MQEASRGQVSYSYDEANRLTAVTQEWVPALRCTVKRRCTASGTRSHRPRLLRVFPRGFRQRHGALGGFHRLGIGRGAVANAPRYALGDAGEPKQIVGKIPVQV